MAVRGPGHFYGAQGLVARLHVESFVLHPGGTIGFDDPFFGLMILAVKCM